MSRLAISLSVLATLALGIPISADAQDLPPDPHYQGNQDDYDPSVELERRLFREEEDGESLRGVCIVQTVPSEADGSPKRVQICH
jgi:hypothetical protein